MFLYRCARCCGLAARSPSTVRQISLRAADLKKVSPTREGDNASRTLPQKNKPFDDAYKIAEKALVYLGKDDVDSVLRMVSLNHDLDLTVTMNHIISHQMSRGSVNAAFDYFLMMKRRQHFPNGHTYTILLEGLARNRTPSGKDKLLKIVAELMAHKFLSPSLIHLNAALKVCAREQDLALAYQIVDSFGSADMTDQDVNTFDSLFHLLRDAVERELTASTTTSSTINSTRVTARHRKVTPTARQHLDDAIGIWKDVVALHRTGTLTIDTRLLISYARVLQKGEASDVRHAIDVVLNLCNLVPFENGRHAADDNVATETTTTTTTEQKDRKRISGPGKGGWVPLDAKLTTCLLEMSEDLGIPALADHVWGQTRAAAPASLGTFAYEARLREVISRKSPAQAIRILEEMKAAKLEVTPTALFLALQCHLTHRGNEDLGRAVHFVKTHVLTPQHPTLTSVPLITLYSRFLKDNMDMDKVSSAVTHLDKVDWSAVIESCAQKETQTQRLREAIRWMKYRFRSLGFRTQNKRLAILFKGFARRLKAAQRVHFPEDVVDRK